MLEGFKIVSLTSGVPTVSITTNGVTFSKNTIVKMGRPQKVLLLIDKPGKRLAIQECTDDNVDAIAFYRDQKSQSVRWNNKDLLNTISNLMGWELELSGWRIQGEWSEEDRAVIFNLSDADKI